MQGVLFHLVFKFFAHVVPANAGTQTSERSVVPEPVQDFRPGLPSAGVTLFHGNDKTRFADMKLCVRVRLLTPLFRKFLMCVCAVGILLLSWPRPLLAYIGPGAGFVFVSSFLALFFALFLAVVYLLLWPIRFLFQLVIGRRSRRGSSKAKVKRMVIIGLDGFDPKLAAQFMEAGKLPNLQRMKQAGTFTPLATSYPSISPVAWSSFATGADPSFHNIFDFLTRDPCTYAPMLSSVDIQKASRVLSLGRFQFPLSKPLIKLKRKSQTFWSVLGTKGVFSSVLRVPITFPPAKWGSSS